MLALALATGLLSTATSAASAAPVVKGEILRHYQALGGPRGLLGAPLTDELATPHRPGRYTVFQGGSIYWSARTGAWEVHGLIRDAWGRLGWEDSLLGFPTADEQPRARGGAVSRFEGGSLYWSPASGAHEVHGDILAAYAALGAETGRLGYPVTDELRTPGRTGAYSAFQGGAVYWSPTTGAHQVEGVIRATWEALGAETSVLGFPVDDEHDRPGGRVSDFEGGQITWTPELGAVVTRARAQVSGADTRRNAVTLADVQQTYTWDADDEFAVLEAGDDGEPRLVTQRQFEAQLDAELASGRVRPYLVVDYALAPSTTSRFTLEKQSEPG